MRHHTLFFLCVCSFLMCCVTQILSFPIHRAESNFPTFDKEFEEECYKVRLELEGTPKSRQVEALIKKVALARLETGKKVKEIGEIEKEKRIYERPLRILGLRSELEDFIEDRYPKGCNSKTNETIYGRPPKKSYMECLSEIVISRHPNFAQNPYIQMFRNRLAERNITGRVFLKHMRWLYGQTSGKAAHKMAQFSPVLPEYHEVDEIRAMLKCVGIKRDEGAVVSIQIVLQPYNLPDNVKDTAYCYHGMSTTESDTDCRSENHDGCES